MENRRRRLVTESSTEVGAAPSIHQTGPCYLQYIQEAINQLKVVISHALPYYILEVTLPMINCVKDGTGQDRTRFLEYSSKNFLEKRTSEAFFIPADDLLGCKAPKSDRGK
uniref:Uncharacterized protein n=1 Tax=Setaria digitata TaxID=48799 RepID=A0A915Q1U7_9BILA